MTLGPALQWPVMADTSAGVYLASLYRAGLMSRVLRVSRIADHKITRVDEFLP